MSVGSATKGKSVPTSGTGTYYGYTGGRYVASNGAPYFTISNLTSNVNFAARTLTFSTSGTIQSADLMPNSFSSNSGLNLSGNLAWARKSNSFSGNISSGNGMNGTASGLFYGPKAEEMGGTFAIKAPSGISGYIGGFGARR